MKELVCASKNRNGIESIGSLLTLTLGSALALTSTFNGELMKHKEFNLKR